MTLWGNLDNATGNQKPVFANTSNHSSSSTIHGSSANSYTYYGNMMGVSATEQAAVAKHGAHSGWVSQKIGTGPIKEIQIATGGQGINAAGFLTITDTSSHGQGTGANVSYTIANSANVLQASSSNARLNAIATLTIVDGGSGFSNSSQITVIAPGANIVAPTFTVTLGGRGDRVSYETIIATGTITGDDPRDNAFFSGV